MQEADKPQQQQPQTHQLQRTSLSSLDKGRTAAHQQQLDGIDHPDNDGEYHYQPSFPQTIDDNKDSRNINDLEKSLSIDDDENNNDSMVVSLDMSQNNEQPMSASEEILEDPLMLQKDIKDCDDNDESGGEQMIEEIKLESDYRTDNKFCSIGTHQLVGEIRLQLSEEASADMHRIEDGTTLGSISSSKNQETMDHNLDIARNKIPSKINSSGQQQQQLVDTEAQSFSINDNKSNIEPSCNTISNTSHKRTKNVCSKACCPKHHHHHKQSHHQHYHQHSTDESKTKYILDRSSSYHNHTCTNNVGSASNIAREEIPNSSTSLGSTKLGHDRKLSRLSDQSDTLPTCSVANSSLHNKNDTNYADSNELVKSCHHSSHQHHHYGQSHGHHHHHRHHHHNNKKRSQEMIENNDCNQTTATSEFIKSTKVVSSDNSNDNNTNYCNNNITKQCTSFNHCTHSHHYHRHQPKHDHHCREMKVNGSKSSKSLSACSQSSSIEIGCASNKMQTTSSSSSATVTSATTVISNATGPLATKARVLDPLDERQQQSIQSSQRQHSKHQSSCKTKSVSGSNDENTIPAPIGFQNEIHSFNNIQDDIIKENEPMDSSNNICRSIAIRDNSTHTRKHSEHNSLATVTTQPTTCCNHRINNQSKQRHHHHHHHNHHHHHHPSTHREHQTMNNQPNLSQQQQIISNVQVTSTQQGSTSNQPDNQSIRYSHKHHHHHHHGHHKHKHKLRHKVSISSHATEVERPVNLNGEQVNFSNNSAGSISSTVDISGATHSDPSKQQSEILSKSTSDKKIEQNTSIKQLEESTNDKNNLINGDTTSNNQFNRQQICETVRELDAEMVDNMSSDNSQQRIDSKNYVENKNVDAKIDEDDGRMVLDQDDRDGSVNGADTSTVVNMDMSSNHENDAKGPNEKLKSHQVIIEQTNILDQEQSGESICLQAAIRDQTRDGFVVNCQSTTFDHLTTLDETNPSKLVKSATDQCRDANINTSRQAENTVETKENIAPSKQKDTNLKSSPKGSVEKDYTDLLTVEPIKCSSSNFSVRDVAPNQTRGGDYINTDRRCKLCWCCCCPCSGLSHRSICHRDSKLSLNNGSDRTNQTNRCDMMPTCGTPTLEEIRSWGESFDRLMKCYDGRRIFRDFLRCEYSEENILFWLACQELKREKDLRSIEAKARMIYEDYISILSTKEVSLDSRVREVINKNMESPTADIFDEAQLQIYTLMHRDSYPRFINSSMYKKLAQLPTSSRKSSS